MTMRIRFIRNYSDPVKKEHSDYKAGDDAFLPRKLGVYLVRNEFAVPFVEWKRKAELAVSKVEPERAVVDPVIEKVEIPEELEEIAETEPELEEETVLCKGFLANGDPCTATPKEGSVYCWRHEPKE